MKQTDKILMYMQTEGEITQAVASDLFGCTRLAARISDLLDGIPPAKVKPVVKGEWKNGGGETLWTCSVCGNDSCCKGNYCPDCGADMRKEANRENRIC